MHPRSEGRGRPGGDLFLDDMYDTAARMFAEKGFAATSLLSIAKEMGVSRQALYNYIDSKDQILAHLVMDDSRQLLHALARLRADSTRSPIDKVRIATRSAVRDRATNQVRFHMLVLTEPDMPPEVRRSYLDSRRVAYQAVRGIIEEGIRSRVFRPVDAGVATLSVLGMWNWVAYWFDAGSHDLEHLVEQIADNCVAMLVLHPEQTKLSSSEPFEIIEGMKADLEQLGAAIKRLSGAHGVGSAPTQSTRRRH